MDEFVQVARSNQVRERLGYSISIGEKKVALFRYKGKVYALRDSCPHQAAPISDGYVDDGFAVCSHHGWKFKLEDGSFIHNGLMRIPSYPVRENDGIIYVKIDK